MEFSTWLSNVEKILSSEPLYQQAKGKCADLEELRGDEPRDVFKYVDTPQTYAKFLVEEWKLFGPEGE